MNELREQLTNIENRNKEIDGLIAKETDVSKIENLRKEKEDNLVKRGELNVKISDEEAETLRNADLALNNPNKRKEATEMVLTKRSARNIWLGAMFRSAMDPTFKLDENTRASLSTLTTTSPTYVAPSANVTGINNSGVMIPTVIMKDLLDEYVPDQNILTDVLAHSMAIPGLLVFPYRKSRTKAQPRKEGDSTSQASWEWGKLSATAGFLQLDMPISDEANILNTEDFGSYCANLMVQDLTEDWATEIIYADGKVDANSIPHIIGITAGLTAQTYAAGGEVNAIIAGLKAVPKKYAKGARIYLAHDLYLALVTTLDSNKRPILENALSASAKIDGMFGYVATEEYALNDGEFIIGNMSRCYFLNQLQGIKTEPDRHAASHVTDLITSVYCATAAVSDGFVWGKKSA